MNVLAFVTVGFAPGVFWLWLIYQRDRYIPAPVHLVVRTFLWGVAVAVPVALAEAGLSAVTGFRGDFEIGSASLGQAAYTAFVVAGLTEEVAKFFVVRRTVYESPYFRQPLDGIIFAAAAALGFASIENVGYMFSFGPAVILARGPFSTLAHVLFSAMFGYVLGARKLGKLWPIAVPFAVAASMALHGFFDFFLFAQGGLEPWSLVLFLAMALLFIGLVHIARRQSPYRHKVATLLVACLTCRHRSGYGAFFCTACGSSLAAAKQGGALRCGQCDVLVAQGHHFCTGCGSRLNRKLASGLR